MPSAKSLGTKKVATKKAATDQATTERAATDRAATKKAAPRTRQPRLRAEEREQQILHGAIRYFSEKGFAGQTRELSRRLGVTQPLLYRYFKSKKELIDKVYLHVFMGRWQPHWVEQLQNRAVALEDRLIAFYREYARATYQPEWIRIYMFAGLENSDLNRRYLTLIKQQLLVPCCRELRAYCGMDDDTKPVSEHEIEFYWTLHDGLFYTAIRDTIYRSPLEIPLDDKVRYAVLNFLAGAKTVYPQLIAATAA